MTAAPQAIPDATRLAVDRTRLAHDRTLLAWIRTAVSLISFGFTVYKFFQALQDTKDGEPVQRMLSPREFGMSLIGLGLVSLVLATIQHRREMTMLRRTYPGVPVPGSISAVLGTIVAAFGIIALVLVFFRQ